MTSTIASTRKHLRSLLAGVRRRVSVRVFASTWIVLSSGFLAAYAALGALQRLALQPLAMWASADRIYVVIGILCVSALPSAIWARRRAPDMAEAARFLDRRFRLDDIASTVVGLPAQEGTISRVERALMEELSERMRMIDVREALPFRLPRWFLVLPASLLLNGIAAVVPEAPRSAHPDALAAGAAPDFEKVAQQLTLVSQTLDAESGDTAQDMAALSAAFRELGERVSGGRISQEAASEELAALLEHLARAVRGTDSPLERVLLGASSANRIASTDDRGGTENAPAPFRFGDGDTSSEDGEAAEAAEAAAAASKESAFDPSSVFRTLGEVAKAIEERSNDGSATDGQVAAEAEAGAEAAGASGGGYYTDWDEQMAADLAARTAALRQRGQGQVAVGGASESDDAPGDAAGSGERPLDEGSDVASFARQDLEAEDVALSAVERVGGRTVTRVADPTLGDASGAELEVSFLDSLVAGPEFPVRRDSVGAQHRDTIIEYFLPPGASRSVLTADGVN
jgi:hypothetical protein